MIEFFVSGDFAVWIDFALTLFIAGILAFFWWRHSRADRRRWQCVRYQGGGRLYSPTEMTDMEVTKWLAQNNCEVTHIDYEYGFVFYKPRGG